MQSNSQDRPKPPRPWRLFLTILAIIFLSEAIVMILLPWIVPRDFDYVSEALVDAFLLTCVLAPLLWWIVIVPLRDLVESRLRLLHRVFTVQEEERARIARDLHDGLGQAMTSLLVRMRAIEEATADPKVLDQIRDVRKLGSDAYDQVRQISRGLRPAALDDFGLAPAIRRFLDEATKPYSVRVDARLASIEDRRLPELVETNLYRVIQEATTNSLKHASPSEISLQIDCTGDGLHAEFCDNGAGFGPAELNSARSGDGEFGLWSMRERMATLAGSLRVESKPGGGTIIKFYIPPASLKTYVAADPSPHRR